MKGLAAGSTKKNDVFLRYVKVGYSYVTSKCGEGLIGEMVMREIGRSRNSGAPKLGYIE